MKNLITFFLLLISLSVFAQTQVQTLRINPDQSKEKQYIPISVNGKHLLSTRNKTIGQYETKGYYNSILLDDLYNVFEEKIIAKASTDLAVTAENGVLNDAGVLKLGDDAEGIAQDATLTSDRYINHNGNEIIHALKPRTATSDGAVLKSILDLETGSTVAFKEWIGTTVNAGSATNNFTYYVGFNLNTNGSLIDPTKHGFGEGYEYWYEPVTGEVYAEKHLVLVIGEDVYRVESWTLPISNFTTNSSRYGTYDTWFMKSPTNGGQYAEFDHVSATTTNFNLLASGQVQKGMQLTVTHDGTNNGVQLIPFGASTGKSFSLAQWYDAALPSLTCLNTPGDPNGKLTFVNDRLYPSADNDCELGADGFRYKQIFGVALDIETTGNDPSFTVSSNGIIKLASLTDHIYADDAAAGAGGLTAGSLYMTATGELRIKL